MLPLSSNWRFNGGIAHSKPNLHLNDLWIQPLKLSLAYERCYRVKQQEIVGCRRVRPLHMISFVALINARNNSAKVYYVCSFLPRDWFNDHVCIATIATCFSFLPAMYIIFFFVWGFLAHLFPIFGCVGCERERVFDLPTKYETVSQNSNACNRKWLFSKKWREKNYNNV